MQGLIQFAPLCETFDDDAYATEVLNLRLQDGQSEDKWDEGLKSAALQLGIEPRTEQHTQRIPFTAEASAYGHGRPRSISIESHSTGLVSNLSRNSIERSNAPRSHLFAERRRPKNSISGSRDTFLQQLFRRDLSQEAEPSMHEEDLVPPSLDSPKKESRMKRGIARLKKINKGGLLSSVTDCPSDCPCSAAGANPAHHAKYEFPCGHIHCLYYVRKMVENERKGGEIPTCCNKRIPQRLLAKASEPVPPGRKSTSAATWDDTTSMSSGQDEGTHSMERVSSFSSAGTTDAPAVGNSMEALRNLKKAMEISDFRRLRLKQVAERDRYQRFKDGQERELEQRQEERRLKSEHQAEEARAELEAKHDRILAQLEERHLNAELELEESQKTEARMMGVRIQHMEAYMQTASSPGLPNLVGLPNADSINSIESVLDHADSSSVSISPSRASTSTSASSLATHNTGDSKTNQSVPNRIMTDNNVRQLKSAYWARDNLAKKQEAEINVLREQQAKRLLQRQQQQEAELDKFDAAHEKALMALEKQDRKERDELRTWLEGKRQRMQTRWNLEVEIWRKKLENDTGVYFSGPIKSVEWALCTSTLASSTSDTSASMNPWDTASRTETTDSPTPTLVDEIPRIDAGQHHHLKLPVDHTRSSLSKLTLGNSNHIGTISSSTAAF